jgi:predicted  nucleic acid-binding Zn-ribbon protein
VIPVNFLLNNTLRKEKDMSDKDAYVQKLHVKLDEWNAEIDKLKAKANKAEAESRLEYQKEIESLQRRRKAAEEKLSEVRQAGEGAWKDLKSGVQNAWDSMEEAVKSARSRFK